MWILDPSFVPTFQPGIYEPAEAVLGPLLPTESMRSSTSTSTSCACAVVTPAVDYSLGHVPQGL